MRLNKRNKHKEFYRKWVKMNVEFNNGSAYFGDALETLKQIKSDSVDSVITSPPYYQLRDYGFDSQWGLESDYNEYLDNLINLMREIKRVLKSTGTIWINLGDTYAGSKSGNDNPKMNSNVCDTQSKINKKVKNMPNKSLMMIPHRFAIRCVDELGLILRNDIIWASKNKMPEPTTDRFSKKKEYIFFFTKSTKYYFDLDGIRDIPITGTNRKDIIKSKTSGSLTAKKSGREKEFDENGFIEMKNNPMGKNPGDVSDFWEITTKPNSKNHYATYNSELIRKPLIAGSPVGGVVLDPFGGTGTTCFSAVQFDRRFIYIDANKEYYDNFVKEMSYQESHYKINFDSDMQKVG